MSITVKLDTGKNFNVNREIDIKQFMPTVLRDVDEVKVIMSVQNDAMKKHWDITEEIFDNQFICTADIEGIKLFENMHDIKPLDTDSLEQRRLTLWLLYNQTAPLTRKYMHQFLNTLIGASNYELNFITEEFTAELNLKFTDGDHEDYKTIAKVYEWVEKVTPYTMLIKNAYTREYNLHEYIGGAYSKGGASSIGVKHIKNNYLLNEFCGFIDARSGSRKINIKPIYNKMPVYMGMANIISGNVVIKERID